MPFKVDWLWLIVGIAIGLVVHGCLDHEKFPVSYPSSVRS